MANRPAASLAALYRPGIPTLLSALIDGSKCSIRYAAGILTPRGSWRPACFPRLTAHTFRSIARVPNLEAGHDLGDIRRRLQDDQCRGRTLQTWTPLTVKLPLTHRPHRSRLGTTYPRYPPLQAVICPSSAPVDHIVAVLDGACVRY